MKRQSSKLYWALTRNAGFEFLRDPLVNMFAFAMPVMFFAIFSITAAITGADRSSAPAWQIAIINGEQTPAARSLAQAINDLSTVTVHRLGDAEARSGFQRNELQAVIELPLQWQGFGSSGIRVLTRPYARTAIEDALAFAKLRKDVQGPAAQQLRDVTFSEIAPEGGGFFQYTIVGLLGFALLQLGLFGTASPILTSKQQGVFRRYGLTPMPIPTFVLSHVTVRVLIAFLQTLVLTIAAVFIVKLQLRGGVGALAGVTLASALALISLGYLIGGSFRRPQLGLVVVLLLNFWMLLFGQIFADLSKVPVMNLLIYANPLTYASDGFRHVFLGAEGRLLPLWGDILALVVWSIAFLLLTFKTFTFEARFK